jgi:hypothetical protein
MYSKIALCAKAFVGHDWRSSSSVLIVAKNDSATALSQHCPFRPTDNHTEQLQVSAAGWVADVPARLTSSNAASKGPTRRWSRCCSSSGTRRKSRAGQILPTTVPHRERSHEEYDRLGRTIEYLTDSTVREQIRTVHEVIGNAYFVTHFWNDLPSDVTLVWRACTEGVTILGRYLRNESAQELSDELKGWKNAINEAWDEYDSHLTEPDVKKQTAKPQE